MCDCFCLSRLKKEKEEDRKRVELASLRLTQSEIDLPGKGYTTHTQVLALELASLRLTQSEIDLSDKCCTPPPHTDKPQNFGVRVSITTTHSVRDRTVR